MYFQIHLGPTSTIKINRNDVHFSNNNKLNSVFQLVRPDVLHVMEQV